MKIKKKKEKTILWTEQRATERIEKKYTLQTTEQRLVIISFN